MPLIKLTVSQLENVRSQVANIASKTEECSNSVANIRNGLDMEVAARRNIEEKLSQISTKLQKQSESANSYSNVLNDVINNFTLSDHLLTIGNMVNIVNNSIHNTTPILGSIGLGAMGAAGLLRWKLKQRVNHAGAVAGVITGQSQAFVLKPNSHKLHSTALATATKKKHKKSLRRRIEDKIVKTVKKTYGNVKKATKDCISWAKKSYKEHGAVYKAIQYGKAALKVGKAVVKIAGAVGTIATGVGVPIALLSIVSAGNDILNAVNDTAYVATGQYDQVGQNNVLKDFLAQQGGKIGSYFGNEAAGETFGKLVYTGIDVVTMLDGADKMLKAYGRVNTSLTGTTGYSSVWGKTTFDDVFKHEIKFDFKADVIARKIMHVHPSSEGNLIYEAASSTWSSLKKAWKVGKSVSDIAQEIAK